MKLAKALNSEAKKNIAHGVKPKPKKEKKPQKKEKEDYRITYCKFVKIDDPNDLVSAISWKPAVDIHHIFWRRGDLYSEPYNMIPLTREEHIRIQAHNSYENKETIQAIAKVYIQSLLSNTKPHIYDGISQMTSTI